MKRKFIITLFTFFCHFVISNAQNAIALPSANNSFLGVAGSIGSATGVNVDLYTGTAQINVPVCNLASRETTIPISLSYIGARGIRVQDYAGSVGLGWQLNAGGSISRVVRCFPDEQLNGYLGTGQWGKVIANEYGNNITWSSTQFTAITGINGTSFLAPTADGEPDIFYVKTPFFSFQFTFDENGNPVVSNNTGIKIITNNFYNSSNYTNSSFEVIDNNGNQYYFGSTASSVETSTALLYGTSYTFPTTWYLDKIVTYNAKDVVTLSYANYFVSDIINHYQSSTTFDYFGNQNSDNTPIQTTINAPKVISKIITSLGELDFNYLTTGRRDDANAVALSSITLNSFNPQTQTNSNLLKTFNFTYSYFGDPATDPNLLRLRLDNLAVVGNTSETSSPLTLNSFVYNTTINLPSRQSLSAVDFFGYYSYSSTGNLYNQSLPPNLTYAQANILTTINDLSGVSNQITYELNSYYNTTSLTNIDVGGLRVSQITKKLSTGESLFTQYKYVDNSNNSTGQVLSNSYMINYFSNCGMTKTLSESPSNYYDLNGNYIGYSFVKVINQNGGYSTYTFSNFSDPNCNDNFNYASTSGIPDITSSISSAYKRGLLLDQANYTATGQIISEDITPLTSYVSLTTPISKASWAYHWANISLSVNGAYCSIGASSNYWTNVENYRLAQTTHRDYDQNNSNNYVQTTTNYSYLTNSTVLGNNNHQIKSITTTNSKSNTVIKTLYYPDDPITPMITSSEQTAITAMVNANRLGSIVHEVSNNNGAITQSHYSFSTGSANNNGGYANTYLTSTTSYNGTTQVGQQLFNYNLGTSNLSSSYILNGKPTSLMYDYNFSYPVAKIINANSTYTQNQGTGGFGTVFTGYYSTSFTVGYTGTISWNLYFNGYPGSGTVFNISYNLNGPTTRSGNLCMSLGGSCPNYASASFTNMPVGTYYISFYVSGGSASIYCNGSYPQLQSNFTNEFYFEGFEQETYSTITGGAHTGNAYYNNSAASYYLPFALPNGRSYTLQYWSLVNGIWIFNEQAYTGPQYISGLIDDIRVFPSDALMTTYTYNPLIGKTGETDPSGRTATYEYDGLGRQSIVRDNNKNIVTKTCYSYAGQPVPCSIVSTIPITICCNGSGNSWAVSLTNTVTGQVYFQGIPITPSYNIGTSFNIPPGTYNVSIYWQYMGQGSVSGPTGGSHLLTFGSYSQYGTNSLSLSNLTITSPLTVSIPF